MTADEVRVLLDRLAAMWPPGLADVARQEWGPQLMPLDAGAAGTALVRLSRERTERPALAVLLDAYRSTHTTTTDPWEKPDRCEMCDGTGWAEHPGLLETAGPVSAVQPCPSCRAGGMNDASAARIAAERDPGVRTLTWAERDEHEAAVTRRLKGDA